MPWWSAIEDLKQQIQQRRAQEGACGQVSQGWRTVGSQTHRDLQGQAGTGSRGGSPPALFLPPWCHCPWFQGGHGGGCLSVSLSSSLLAAFSCSPPLTETMPSGGLLTSAVCCRISLPCVEMWTKHTLIPSDGRSLQDITLRLFDHDAV